MLELDVILSESFDEVNRKFSASATRRVQLEHSLVSLSKWESVFEKPFLGREEKTEEEILAYIEMMFIGDKPSPEILLEVVKQHTDDIRKYIDRKMTATRIAETQRGSGGREIITSELIYSWMVSMGIPFETQHWHINRLLMLIRVIGLKNTPKKKMTAQQRAALNNQRLAQHNTRG